MIGRNWMKESISHKKRFVNLWDNHHLKHPIVDVIVDIAKFAANKQNVAMEKMYINREI